MTNGTRRTVLNVRVLVETTNTDEKEHERAVQWASERIKLAPSRIRNGFVATRVQTRDGRYLGLSTYGQAPSDDTKEIEADFFEEPEIDNG